MSVRRRPNLRLLMSLLLLAFPATAIAQAVEHDVIIIGAMEPGLRAAGEIDEAIEPVPEPSFFIVLLAGGGGVLALARLRGVPPTR